MAGPRPRHPRDRYTVLVEALAANTFRLAVRELPETWTVAFDRDEIEERARHRIALDLGCDPSGFAIELEPPQLLIARRANYWPED